MQPKWSQQSRVWGREPGCPDLQTQVCSFQRKAFIYENKCPCSTNDTLCFTVQLAARLWQAHLSHLPFYGNLTMPNPVAWPLQHEVAYWFQLMVTVHLPIREGSGLVFQNEPWCWLCSFVRNTYVFLRWQEVALSSYLGLGFARANVCTLSSFTASS